MKFHHLLLHKSQVGFKTVVRLNLIHGSLGNSGKLSSSTAEKVNGLSSLCQIGQER